MEWQERFSQCMTNCMTGGEPTEEPTNHADVMRDAREDLRQLNMRLHHYMMRDEVPSSSNEWKETYILTRAIDTLVDTITVFNTHSYPPF
jgi:RecB family exonuclease